jgi:mannan endo-1,4-beta-mannosidase
MIVGWQRAKNRLRNTGLLVLVFALLSVPAVVSAADDPSATSFIKTSGTNLTLDGRPFFVAGVNNHCLTFASQDEVTRVLDGAVTTGANVVRTLPQPVIDGLGAEERCVREVLPRAVASDLRPAMRGKVSAVTEALSQHRLSRVGVWRA